MAATKVVAMSDTHPGDPASYFERHDIQRAAIDAIAQEGPVDELVLAGDILDLDYGTLPIAIEGRTDENGNRGAGLRSFLQGVCRDTQVAKIVYVPGNHDYAVFDMLATRRDHTDVLDAGDALDYEPMFSGSWPAPFLRGLMMEGRRDDLTVRYPNHILEIGGLTVLLTHGHHLDRHQTLLMPLAEVVDAPDPDEAKREFLSGIAGYQTFVHATSYARRTRRLAYLWMRWLGRLFSRVASLRGKKMGFSLRHTIELYMRHFCDEPADVFVFGHTHVPGHWETLTLRQPHNKDRHVAIYNCGAFVAVDEAAATFLVLSADDGGPVRVEKVVIRASAEWKKVRLHGA